MTDDFDDEDYEAFEEQPEITPPNEDGSVCVSQISLIGAISEHLAKMHGNIPLRSRQVNAVIEAANLIVRELRRPVVMATAGMGLAAWLSSDDTGMSSKYMASVLSDPSRCRENNYPHDPEDFGRCLRLLAAAPELRIKLPRLTDKKHGPVWNTLGQHWSELEQLYNEEHPTGLAPKLYARMQELIQEATPKP